MSLPVSIYRSASDRNPKAGAGKGSLDAGAFAVRLVLEKSLELYQSDSIMTNREAGINVVREMMGDQAAAKLSSSADSNTFGAPIAAYAVDQVLADIWTRPGLDRRSRGLVSMSVMIAMRQPHEFAIPIQLHAMKSRCSHARTPDLGTIRGR